MDEGLAHLLNKQDAKAVLGTDIIGKKIFAYDLVTSTNDLCHFFAEKNEPEGTVVFAKGQTQGRGRLGNVWISPPGKGLTFSFILRPGIKPRQATLLTLMTALGVARSLAEIPVDDVAIKWPNDILIKDRKVCGILTEMNLREDKINYVVVGVGLNVNTSQKELPDQATSLKEAAGREFDIADLSHIIMKKIDHYYGLLLQHEFSGILKEVKHFSGLILGGRVKVTWLDREVQGYVLDFDEDGGLVIRTDNGFLEKVTAGHLVKL